MTKQLQVFLGNNNATVVLSSLLSNIYIPAQVFDFCQIRLKKLKKPKIYNEYTTTQYVY